ncbi:hypothetical protein Tco_1547242 [Tanacetum coccineum]
MTEEEISILMPCRYLALYSLVMKEDDSIPLGDIIARYSTVENLVPFPSEFEGMSDDTSDVLTCDNNYVNVESDFMESLINRDTSIVYSSKIDPILEEFAEVNDDQEEKEFDLDDIFQIQDVILREKLLNVHRLITNIESLNNNPTLDRVLESPFPFPIPVADSDSFLEESDTSLSHLDNSLPGFETSSDQKKSRRSARTTTQD